MVHGCTHTRHGDIRNEVMALLLARTRTGRYTKDATSGAPTEFT